MASRAKTQDKHRAGFLRLTNLGNTCYMNSALQCLVHIAPLQKYFCQMRNRVEEVHDSTTLYAGRAKLAKAFLLLFEEAWMKTESSDDISEQKCLGGGKKHQQPPIFEPQDILGAMKYVNESFWSYSQQDTQEFLRVVLDNLHEFLKEEHEKLPSFWKLSTPSLFATPHSPFPSVVDESLPQIPTDNMESRSFTADEFSTPEAPRAMYARSANRPLLTKQISNIYENSTDASMGLRERRKDALCCDRRSDHPKDALCCDRRNLDRKHSDQSIAQSRSPTVQKNSLPTDEEYFKRGPSSSIISGVFQGSIASSITCHACNNISRTVETFYDVSVPIPTHKERPPPSIPAQRDTYLHEPDNPSQQYWKFWNMFKWKGQAVELTDCIGRFCQLEILQEKYQCDKCKSPQEASKFIKFSQNPEVFCFHLKRFRYDNGWFGAKNKGQVNFKADKYLDLSPFSEEEDDCLYGLVGLIQHTGSMGSGHYIAYCRVNKNAGHEWWLFDDDSIKRVSSQDVQKAEPYLLFYQKIPSKSVKKNNKSVNHIRSRFINYFIRNRLTNYFSNKNQSIMISIFVG
eukprot:GHVL01041062.1.p1 GENE.GHVL01041062.1~~GHVL01041062.1.p1  ORF type:complete len:571 (-),score=89.87 GHVL01041062.1:155-1867(-)